MASITKDAKEGYEVSGKTKTTTSYRMWLFSGGWPRFEGWPAKNVHTDLEFAQACGFPTKGASGAMPVGYLTELMVDLFGENWLRQGDPPNLNLKFIRVMDVDDKITARARVASKHEEESGVRFDMDLWCENQDGDKVVVGTGTGWAR